jgi:hypothetical protein
MNLGHRPSQLLAAAFVAASMFTVGCASPTGPSQAPPSAPSGDIPAARVTLTVRVLARSTEVPLPGAVVQLGGQADRADAGGVCEFTLTPGTMADVDVSAAGYKPMGASAVLQSNERWTFYLEPAASAQPTGFVARH